MQNESKLFESCCIIFFLFVDRFFEIPKSTLPEIRSSSEIYGKMVSKKHNVMISSNDQNRKLRIFLEKGQFQKINKCHFHLTSNIVNSFEIYYIH